MLMKRKQTELTFIGPPTPLCLIEKMNPLQLFCIGNAPPNLKKPRRTLRKRHNFHPISIGIDEALFHVVNRGMP